VVLDAAQQLAVIALSDTDATSGGICSGTLIAPRIVLTAKHCTTGTAGDAFWVLFGMDDTAPVLALQTVRKREHDTVDLTLLELSAAPSDTLAVAPIPITLEDLSDADIGITLEQAGYGYVNTNGTTNGRFFVAEPLDGFETDGNYLVVNGMNVHGVCFGDSGGPSMRISPAGDTRVLGALGYGDPSCVGRDRYTRVDGARAWIEEWTGVTPGAGPRPCGTETATGHCGATGNTAYWCENNVLQQVVCGTGESCAWQAPSSTWRCGPVAADTCGGVTAFGACDGEALSWCDLGTARSRACNQCGERCMLVNDQLGYACVPSDCGDLTYTGHCNGTTAEWCSASSGQKATEDCSANGGSCGYAGPDQGYYCLPSSCGGLDYLGRCDGDVVRWCDNGRQRSRNCSTNGQVCRMVDAATGYFCAAP
jgi:hypothetical protein